ncbi:MAG: hypothetical protein ACOYXU_14725 [Nitrospirota bacterium]
MNFPGAQWVAMLVGALLASPGVPGVGHATMPSVPMSVTLESTGDAAVDADLTVTLTAQPLVDAEQLSMTITLPEGVDLVAGDAAWTGKVRAHESRALIVTVRPRRAADAVIRGQVRLDFPDGTTLGETRSLSLELGDRAKQSLGIGIAPPKKTGTGEPVIEFHNTP